MKTFNRLCLMFAATVVIVMMGCASTDKKEGTGEYIDDTVITAKVKAALIDDPDLKATEINVETFKGIVQLSGFVSSASHISKATTLAKDIKGVKSVKNDIRLK
ncbi:MAG: BON domain-containing protein [Flavobacterium sp.]|nr:MAG: BON domain-containing protein [Flavobacterium sp.]